MLMVTFFIILGLLISVAACCCVACGYLQERWSNLDNWDIISGSWKIDSYTGKYNGNNVPDNSDYSTASLAKSTETLGVNDSDYSIILLKENLLTITNKGMMYSRVGFSAPGRTGLKIEQAFTAQTSVHVIHNLGSTPAVFAKNSFGTHINYQNVVHHSMNDFTITFSSSTTGTVVAVENVYDYQSEVRFIFQYKDSQNYSYIPIGYYGPSDKYGPIKVEGGVESNYEIGTFNYSGGGNAEVGLPITQIPRNYLLLNSHLSPANLVTSHTNVLFCWGKFSIFMGGDNAVWRNTSDPSGRVGFAVKARANQTVHFTAISTPFIIPAITSILTDIVIPGFRAFFYGAKNCYSCGACELFCEDGNMPDSIEVDLSNIDFKSTHKNMLLSSFNPPFEVKSTVAADGSNTALTFKTDLGPNTNPNGAHGTSSGYTITFTSGLLNGQSKEVTGFVGSTRFITVGSAFTTTPNAGDKFTIAYPSYKIAKYAGGGTDPSSYVEEDINPSDIFGVGASGMTYRASAGTVTSHFSPAIAYNATDPTNPYSPSTRLQIDQIKNVNACAFDDPGIGNMWENYLFVVPTASDIKYCDGQCDFNKTYVLNKIQQRPLGAFPGDEVRKAINSTVPIPSLMYETSCSASPLLQNDKLYKRTYHRNKWGYTYGNTYFYDQYLCLYFLDLGVKSCPALNINFTNGTYQVLTMNPRHVYDQLGGIPIGPVTSLGYAIKKVDGIFEPAYVEFNTLTSSQAKETHVDYHSYITLGIKQNSSGFCVELNFIMTFAKDYRLLFTPPSTYYYPNGRGVDTCHTSSREVNSSHYATWLYSTTIPKLCTGDNVLTLDPAPSDTTSGGGIMRSNNYTNYPCFIEGRSNLQVTITV